MIVLAKTQAEHDALMALNVPFEFEIFDVYGPAYKINLVRRCRQRGIELANMATPTGTLELWLRCSQFDTFIAGLTAPERR